MRRVTLLLLWTTTFLACREKAERRVSEQPALPPPPTDSAPPPDRPPAAVPPLRTTTDTAYYPAGSTIWPPAPRANQLDTILARDADAAPLCGGTATPRLTADSIGPFRLGGSLSQLRRRCPRLLYGWYYVSDGYAEPAVAVRLSGALVRAFLTIPQSTGTVHRVEVGGQDAKTAEGLGVGSTLDALRRQYGAPGVSESDCDLRVWFASRPGLSFRMEYPPAERRECGALSEEPLPPDLRVVAVILVPR